MKEFKVGEAPWEKQPAKEYKAGEAPWEQEEEEGIGSKALDYGLRALDYAGGLTRVSASGLADLANLTLGKPTVTREGDFTRALQGKAPGTEEYLDRAGVEPGFKRSAIGFVGDIALDPTTYMSGGISSAGKLKKLFNPATALTNKAGNALIRSGVSTIDEVLEIAGKGKLSDIMIKRGIKGTNKSIKKQVDKLGERFSKDRKTLYKKATDAGAKVDSGEIIDEVTRYTDKLRAKTGNQIADDIAVSLEDQLLKALPKDVTEMSLQTASNIKTQLRKNLPDKFYNPTTGAVKDEYKQGVSKIANIIQKKIEQKANKAIPGLGDDIAKKNKEWSILLDADSPLSREARKAAGQRYLTSIDGLILGTAAKNSNPKDLMMLAAKKGADLSKTTWFKTVGGDQLKTLGRTVDPMVRRSLININRVGDENEN